MKSKVTKRRPGSVTCSPFQNLFPNARIYDVFDQFLSDDNRPSSGSMPAAMDVLETEQSFEIKLDLPGVKPEEVDIQIENQTLSIKGKRSHESETKDESKNFHRIERSYGSFSRSLVLPNSVSQDQITADFNDGVLTITVPKEEEAKPRKISINRS